MTSAPTPAESHDQRTQRHLAMLAELADLTLVLTRLASINACEHLAPPSGAEPPPQADKQPDPVLAFARLSRALRQTIALEAKLAAPANTTPKTTAEPSARSWQATPEITAKAHLAEAVLVAAKADKAVIRRHGPTIRHIERHIDERLDADDVAQAIDANEPFAAIVATICEDLGIPYQFSQSPDQDLLPVEEAIQARRSHPAQQTDDDILEYEEDDDDEDDRPPIPREDGRREGPTNDTPPTPQPTNPPPV